MTRFNRIAYAEMEVCNALDIAAVEAAVAAAGLHPGARALDIGTGNAAVAIALARAGLSVTAVEGDPDMAALARDRIAASGLVVDLIEARSGEVLAASAPFDLIVSIGAVEPAGGGLREPADIFAALAEHLAPGGALLWGDVVWKGEPPAPLVQMTGITNTYADDAGWRAAAERTGLQVVSGRLSSQAEWGRYLAALLGAPARWLAQNADDPAAAAVARNAERVRLLFDFGRPFMDFGLYLFRKP
jgi:predicted O-methyltransferase YrrM